MPQPTPIALFGASGRMGLAVLRAAADDAGALIVAALVRKGSPAEGQRACDRVEAAHGDLVLTSDPAACAQARVLLDFSGARAFDQALALALEHGIAFASGTTGLTPQQLAAAHAAAQRIPVLIAANFSLGVALLQRLARSAALALGPGYDVEILEAHHQRKLDAPSGTALALGRAIADARGTPFDDVARLQRGAGERAPGEIGFASLRGGDIVGEHTVLFVGAGERIELVHRAGSRAIFASGALRAARWLAERPAGRYEVDDVLS